MAGTLDPNEPGGTRVIDLLGASMGNGNLTVNGTATVWSFSFLLPRNSSYGLEYQFTSPGTVAVDIKIDHGNAAPSTEGADDTDYVLGDGISTVVSESDELVHFIAIAPVVCQRIRFEITGTGSNDAGTALSRLRLLISKND